MLFPGHFAAGYLVGKALIQFTHANFPAHETHQLLFWAAFFGFAPDLDVFYAATKIKYWGELKNKADHRNFISHAPLPWLVAGLLIFLASNDPYIKHFGLLVWLGSWSHFVLDSTKHGIMWLWPLSSKLYALKKSDQAWGHQEDAFVPYWKNFLHWYITRSTLTFLLEVVIIIFSTVIFINS